MFGMMCGQVVLFFGKNNINTLPYIHTYTYIYAYIDNYVHTYIHTHIHTYIHTRCIAEGTGIYHLFKIYYVMKDISVCMYVHVLYVFTVCMKSTLWLLFDKIF